MKVNELIPSQHTRSLKHFKAFCTATKPTKVFGTDRLNLLHLACLFFDSVNLVDFLITTQGITAFAITKNTKKTALHFAVKMGFYRVVKALVEKHKANQHAVRSRKENALFIAVKYNHTDIAEYLLQRGVDPHIKSTTSTNVALLAAKNGNFKLLTLFKNVGVSLHLVNDHGENALMLAAQSGSLECVTFLVAEGLCTVIHVGNRSLIHYASKHHDVLVWLLNNTTWQRLKTVPILLEIEAPADAFEGRQVPADLVLAFDRHDLLKNVRSQGEDTPENMLIRATGEKTRRCLEEMCRWRRVRGCLFVRSRQCGVLSLLPFNIFREVYKLI